MLVKTKIGIFTESQAHFFWSVLNNATDSRSSFASCRLAAGDLLHEKDVNVERTKIEGRHINERCGVFKPLGSHPSFVAVNFLGKEYDAQLRSTRLAS